MKYTYKVCNLDCAACGQKIARKVKDIQGVKDADLNYMFGKLTVEADGRDENELFDEVCKVSKKVESEVELKKI